ncbi:MAG: NDP-hexose 2,3-dehydratase family protein, partial [Christensenellaceae bacterium]
MIQACDFIRSLTETKGAFRTDELLSWIMRLNETASVSVTETAFTEDGFWYFDRAEGSIHNAKRTFFSIRGIEKTVGGVLRAQPILVQAEIGY